MIIWLREIRRCRSDIISKIFSASKRILNSIMKIYFIPHKFCIVEFENDKQPSFWKSCKQLELLVLTEEVWCVLSHFLGKRIWSENCWVKLHKKELSAPLLPILHAWLAYSGSSLDWYFSFPSDPRIRYLSYVNVYARCYSFHVSIPIEFLKQARQNCCKS